MQSSARRSSPHLPYDHGEPIWRCRYDVLAVVIFMIAGLVIWVDAPMQTHALTFDIPTDGAFDSPLSLANHDDELAHVLSPRADGSIEWNGELVTQSQLLDLLYDGLLQQIEPRIVFVPDFNASYDLSANTLVLVKRSGVTKFCFGELEKHQLFGSEPTRGRLQTTYIIRDIEPIEPMPNPPECSVPDG